MHLSRVGGRLVFRGVTITSGPWQDDRLRGAPYDERGGSVTTALGTDAAILEAGRALAGTVVAVGAYGFLRRFALCRAAIVAAVGGFCSRRRLAGYSSWRWTQSIRLLLIVSLRPFGDTLSSM